MEVSAIVESLKTVNNGAALYSYEAIVIFDIRMCFDAPDGHWEIQFDSVFPFPFAEEGDIDVKKSMIYDNYTGLKNIGLGHVDGDAVWPCG